MNRRTKKQSTEKSVHPLDVLLQEMPEDSKSMLGILAQRNLELVRDKEPGWFTETVTNKIEKLRYRPPDSKRDGRTFNEILKRAGVLGKFLGRSLQVEIEKWVLLRDILRDDRKNKQEGRSDVGFPAKFHRSLMTALMKHLETMEETADKYSSQKEIENYYSSVRKEFVRQAKILISYNRTPSWPGLLAETRLDFTPRDEEVAIRGRIFLVLKTNLQNPRSKKLGISDQFLGQLTELMSGANTERQLRTDRIRYAVNSRTSPGTRPKKSQKIS